MPTRPRGRTTIATPATPGLPLIRISLVTISLDSVTGQSNQAVILSIPRWCSTSCALALRIAATAIESLAAGGWTWSPPKVESGPRGVTAVLTMLVGPPDEFATAREKAFVEALRAAASRETTAHSPAHSLGIMTHRIEVLS